MDSPLPIKNKAGGPAQKIVFSKWHVAYPFDISKSFHLREGSTMRGNVKKTHTFPWALQVFSFLEGIKKADALITVRAAAKK